MCDVKDSAECPVISSTDEYLDKEILSQPESHEENNKDNLPEVKEKPDISSVVPLKVLEKLSDGILSLYVSDLKKSSSSLNELTRNQTIVIETLEQESARVVEALRTYQLDDMFSRIKHYHAKAQILKKEMLSIYDRTSKLKKRAMKMQQQKQKEALQKELQRDRELERDKQLAPKIATKPTPEN
ncbi:biogenesis of lysosome-related organelles complex 1 subunit 6 isoform X2 [Parasteatoda tepidariorum]|nr:biogenesis of lysosome-related organelles complex 1 subunit 6 [Parasteatoda tepidariorum]